MIFMAFKKHRELVISNMEDYMNKTKLTVSDFITIGVFTAVYFLLVTVATFVCALLPGIGNILLPAVAALLSGSVYMLLSAKLKKFGGITIMGLVMGLFFFVSGHFILSFAANIVCGILADLIANGTHFSKKGLLASYVVFSYGLIGPILPLWFMKDAYISNLVARGKDGTYINTLFGPINSGSFVVSMLAILICALIGGFFGQKMMKNILKKQVLSHEFPSGSSFQTFFALAGQSDVIFPCWSHD